MYYSFKLHQQTQTDSLGTYYLSFWNFIYMQHEVCLRHVFVFMKKSCGPMFFSILNVGLFWKCGNLFFSLHCFTTSNTFWIRVLAAIEHSEGKLVKTQLPPGLAASWIYKLICSRKTQPSLLAKLKPNWLIHWTTASCRRSNW